MHSRPQRILSQMHVRLLHGFCMHATVHVSEDPYVLDGTQIKMHNSHYKNTENDDGITERQ